MTDSGDFHSENFTLFTVMGQPVPKARPRITIRGGHAHAYTPTSTKVYETAIAAVARVNISEPLDGPVQVDIMAVMQRPQRLMRKKDPAGFMWCINRPDLDNLYKSVNDSLNGIAYHDDSQVVAGNILKVYTEKDGEPRMIILVRPVLPSAAKHPLVTIMDLASQELDDPGPNLRAA